jgi:hypothetical protein
VRSERLPASLGSIDAEGPRDVRAVS